MKVKAIKNYFDKQQKKRIAKDTIFEAEEKRVAVLKNAGMVEILTKKEKTEEE